MNLYLAKIGDVGVYQDTPGIFGKCDVKVIKIMKKSPALHVHLEDVFSGIIYKKVLPLMQITA